MKTLCIALFSILLTASTAIAGFTLKSGIYRMNELDAAKSTALSGKKQSRSCIPTKQPSAHNAQAPVCNDLRCIAKRNFF